MEGIVLKNIIINSTKELKNNELTESSLKIYWVYTRKVEDGYISTTVDQLNGNSHQSAERSKMLPREAI